MNLEQMRNNIDNIFVRFGAQSVLVGLRATEATIAGAVGLRLEVGGIDNLPGPSPVKGMIFVNENFS